MMNNLQTKFRKMQNKKGFTLIELIVVIVIIGILAAIIVPRLNGFTERAEISTCKANQRTAETALAVFIAENGEDGGTGTDGAITFDDLTDAGLLTEAPTCPSDGTYTINAANGTVTCSVEGH